MIPFSESIFLGPLWLEGTWRPWDSEVGHRKTPKGVRCGSNVKKSRGRKPTQCPAKVLAIYPGQAGAHDRREVIDIHVLGLNGEGCTLTRQSVSTLGRTLRKLVAEKIPAKPGAKLALYHLTQPLILHQNLEQQGIAGESVTISCTYIPTNL